MLISSLCFVLKVKLPDQRSGHLGANLRSFRSDLLNRAAVRHCAKEGIASPPRTSPLAFIPVHRTGHSEKMA
jgi:hypothetical protein